MIDFGAAFGEMAAGFGPAFGGPYWPAVVLDKGAPVTRGGSIVSPGEITRRPCSVQIDSATEAMRQSEGYTDGDVRFLIIGLAGAVNTDASIEIATGPNAGTWLVSTLQLDPVAIGWSGRGRRT